MTTDRTHGNGHPEPGPVAGDELDLLLREWHEANAVQARAGRDRLMAALAPAGADDRSDASLASAGGSFSILRRLLVNRFSPVAAAAMVLLAILTISLLPQTTSRSMAQSNIVLAPDGGRLDALDGRGNALGPCALKHTDVSAEISGVFSRITVRQKYHNPHADKIEAVYTFPLSHRAAVDRMTMTIGDRVIVGQVRERQRARQIYEAARAQGRTASLLEQERPNIFTQSIANIEPGADIDIEISYVELVDQRDGVYSFAFPTTVGPRYIPGTPTASLAQAGPGLPPMYTRRSGLVLLAPGTIRITTVGDTTARGTLTPAELSSALASATPVDSPAKPGVQGEQPPRVPPTLWYQFTVEYPDGSAEPGQLFTDGSGAVNGRWFYTPAAAQGRAAGSPAESGRPDARSSIPGPESSPPGAAYSPNTTQVSDASRITPMPTRPPTRAGHDISITVSIDTGGPGILDLKSAEHQVLRDPQQRDNGNPPSRLRVALANESEIPNRDFVLSWRQTADTIQESTLTHTGPTGNFFSVMLQPPARVQPEQVVPRELVFVLDTSGSMSGFPIEKSKALIAKAIDSMRPADTFNVITFSGATDILWNVPRPNTAENRAEAQQFVASRSGGGGTEMMAAIEAALAQAPGAEPESIGWRELLEVPADGRRVTVDVGHPEVILNPKGGNAWGRIRMAEGQELLVSKFELPSLSRSETLLLTGAWATAPEGNILRVESTRAVNWQHGQHRREGPRPLRIVVFLTDGFVGNDFAIIDAIKKHRGTTRVFPLGIGTSVNRFLIDGMARAGGGEPEVVTLEASADAAVEHLVRRISAPVLANIDIQVIGDLKVTDVLPEVGRGPGHVPDLFDQKPIVILGRYTSPGKGSIIITGTAGEAPFRREIPLELPAAEAKHDVLGTLWARAKVDALMNEDLAAVQHNAYPAELREAVVKLGETFGIMTQYTSFVAVDELRVTVGGKARLVHIPIELPRGVSWEGNFGPGPRGANEWNRPWPQFDEGDYIRLSYGAELASFKADRLRATANASPAELKDGERALLRHLQPVTGGAAAGFDPTVQLDRNDDDDRGPVPMLGDVPVVGQAFAIADRDPAKTPTDPASTAFFNFGSPSKGRSAEAEGLRRIQRGEEHRIGEKDRKLSEDFERIRALQQEQKYEEALQVTDQVLFLDPDNPTGLLLRDALSDITSYKRYGEARRVQNRENGLVQRLSSEEDMIPPQGLMEYPTDLPVRTLRANGTDSPMPAADSAALAALNEKNAPINFDQNSLGDILDFFEVVTQTAINADWASLAAVGVTRESLVTLKRTGAPATEQLSAVLAEVSRGAKDAAPITWTIQDGIVQVLPQAVLSARRPHPRLLLAICSIADLAGAGKLDDARRLAAAVAQAAPKFELGLRLNAILSPPSAATGTEAAPAPTTPASSDPTPPTHTVTASLTPEMIRQLAELRTQAKAQLEPYIRRGKLIARLDPHLLAFADRPNLPTTLDPSYAGETPGATTVLDGGVLLSVLLADTEAPALAALNAAGFRTDQVSPSTRVAVGVLPLGRLADLALLDAVRRIEPTRFVDAPTAAAAPVQP